MDRYTDGMKTDYEQGREVARGIMKEREVNAQSENERNRELGKEYFAVALQLSKTIVFEVRYALTAGNVKAYFATECSQFNQPKTDWSRCGQAQDELTAGHPLARAFWQKWDAFHCKDLTKAQYMEMRKDLETIMPLMNHLEAKDGCEPEVRFCEMKALSKEKPKKASPKEIADAVARILGAKKAAALLGSSK